MSTDSKNMSRGSPGRSAGPASVVRPVPPAVPNHIRADTGMRCCIPWGTVVVLSVLLSLSTAFWIEALQGAVGYIERSQHPFHKWLLDVALLFPVFVVSVLAVSAVARRRYRDLSAPRAVVATGLALTAVATVVGVAALITNSAYDYHLQSNQLSLAQATHSTALSGVDSHAEHGGPLLSQRQTLQTHVKGVELTSGLVLGSNLILIAWVIAARGGRFERAPRGRQAESAVKRAR